MYLITPAFNKVFPPIIFSARSHVFGSTCELQTSLSDNCSAIGADRVHLSCAHSDSIRKRMFILALADKEDTGYPHDGRADKDSYPHDGRADKDSYPHDRHNQYIIGNIILI